MTDPQNASYDQPTKNEARREALSHAVELVTTRREDAAIVSADHPERIRDHLLNSTTHRDSDAARSCSADDLESWRSFRLNSIGTRTRAEITVAYLAGPEPRNDLLVLLELGVRPENIWAFEIDKKAADVGLEELRDLRARGIKFMPVGVEDFFIGTPRRFDVIYFDACAPFPSKDSVRAIATMFRHCALSQLGVLVSNFSCPDVSRPADLERYSFLVAAYLFPKSFLESEEGGSVEGPPAYGFEFNISAEDLEEYGDDEHPSKGFMDEVRANFERYYGLFITRSLMDLATIIAPMSRLMAGELWKIAFNPPAEDAIERGKRLVIFKPDAFSDGESVDGEDQPTEADGANAREDVEDTAEHDLDAECLEENDLDFDGDAIVQPDFFSLIWTLAACGRYDTDVNFSTVPQVAESLIKTWCGALTGKVGGRAVDELLAIFYAWRHDQSLWTPAMQRIGQFPYREIMPFLCDVPTSELGFYPAFAQLAYPAHPNVRETKRFRYVAEGKKMTMFMDVIAFDECRYVYDWISALHLTPEDWEDPSAQLTFRFALDGVAADRRWMGDDFLFGCHSVGECAEFPMSDLDLRIDLSPHAPAQGLPTSADEDGSAPSKDQGHPE